jgi:hypothetical protein
MSVGHTLPFTMCTHPYNYNNIINLKPGFGDSDSLSDASRYNEAKACYEAIEWFINS